MWHSRGTPCILNRCEKGGNGSVKLHARMTVSEHVLGLRADSSTVKRYHVFFVSLYQGLWK